MSKRNRQKRIFKATIIRPEAKVLAINKLMRTVANRVLNCEPYSELDRQLASDVLPYLDAYDEYWHGRKEDAQYPFVVGHIKRAFQVGQLKSELEKLLQSEYGIPRRVELN